MKYLRYFNIVKISSEKKHYGMNNCSTQWKEQKYADFELSIHFKEVEG